MVWPQLHGRGPRGWRRPHLNPTPGIPPLSQAGCTPQPLRNNSCESPKPESRPYDRAGSGWWRAHLARRAGSPGRCRGSRPGSPSRSWTAHSCPTRRALEVGALPGAGEGNPQSPRTPRGRGHTHNPHAVKGHLGVELGHHVLPPVQGVGVGEVREGGGSGPHLEEGRGETRPLMLSRPRPSPFYLGVWGLHR